MKVLVVNGGSSSFKFSIFDSLNFSRQTEPIWKKQIDFKTTSENRKAAIQLVLKEIKEEIDAVGHRIVHGGSLFRDSIVITPDVKNSLKKLSKLAPLHNPVNIEGLEVAETVFPQAKQVGVFDTAFFARIPEFAWTYPGPWEWRDEDIRRYGFHGISHQYCSETVHEMDPLNSNRLITCHLGNGSSCTAISAGTSLDTTMGFTPMEGLMMGTRSGSIDPGIILYLLREKKMSAEEIDECLNKKSGLLGIGGTYNMRQIESKSQQGDHRAILARDIYVHRLKQAIASLSATLGGIDALCFTAGIGENSSDIRQRACDGLKYLGVNIDPNLNSQIDKDKEISSKESKVKIFVVRTREEWMIAKEVFLLL